ncbi:MAG: efflux RND transporter periplasmic adaptor subunit [Bacteroidota bacterium]
MHSFIKSVAGIALLMLAVACKPQYAEQAAESIDESTAKAIKLVALAPETAPLPVEGRGRLASQTETMLSFKIGGLIQTYRITEGKRVQKGQLLAALNPVEIDAQVRQAEQGVAKATRDLERTERLYQDTVATLEQVQDLKTVLELAQADLEIAKFNQQYSRIISPVSGKILKSFAEANQLVNPGDPICLIATGSGSQSLVMRMGLADRDVVRINLGDSAQLMFDAHPGEIFKGSVSEIAENADPRTGAFEVELSLAPSKSRMKSGFIGRANIFPGQQTPYYRVPMNALVAGEAEKAWVFVPDTETSTAHRVQVRPDRIADEDFIISTNELTGHRYLITEGAAYLQAGDSIQLPNGKGQISHTSKSVQQ